MTLDLAPPRSAGICLHLQRWRASVGAAIRQEMAVIPLAHWPAGLIKGLSIGFVGDLAVSVRLCRRACWRPDQPAENHLNLLPSLANSCTLTHS